MLKNFRVSLIKALIDMNEFFFFEKRLTEYYKKIGQKKINVIIDVGANKGQTIQFFRKLNNNCEIFSFEPNDILYKKLKTKYKKDPKIRILNFGVSDKIGEKVFYQNILDYTSSFQTLNSDSKYLQRKAKILGIPTCEIVVTSYNVKTTTLSHFINSEINQDIDVLKIDVEGHEYECLIGLFDAKLNFKIKYIQIEQHTDDMYINRVPFTEIENLLINNNFKVKAVINHGFSELKEYIFYNTNIS